MSDLINVRVKATGDFSDVVGSIKQMQGALNNLKMPNLSDGLSKNLSSLIKEVEKFQSIREKTDKTKGDLKNLDNSAMQIAKIYSNINKELDKMGRADLKKYLNFDSPELKQAQTKVAELENKIRGLYKNLNKNIIKPTIDDKSFSQFAEKSNKLQSMWRQFHFNVDNGDLKEALSTLEQIQKYAPSLKSVVNNTELGGIKGLNKIVDNAKRGITEALTETSKFNSELAESKQHLNNLVSTRVEGLSSGIQKITNSLNQMESETMQAVNAERQLAHESYNIGSQLGVLKTSANYFFGLQNMFYLMRSGLRETLDTVKELDKAMTDTAVVTDMSVGDLWKQLPDYTELANKLGATTKGAYETMTLYYQQGLDKRQTFEIGEETMKMARIAGLDYAETTNMMTAALRGFNMELNQTSAKHVNDVYSKLAAITASDTKELGSAMERTASIAHSANMDFGTTTAFLAQMIETTREAPENLGTAMKTIIARFQELKENPMGIGEVEGEEVSFNRVDKALKTIGVDLVDSKEKFRDLDDVFLEIASKWDGLTQTQQRYIATTAAGSRQQSRFIAMMDNYKRTLQLVDAAENSEGASDVQFAKTLDSMEAKLNRLGNAWDKFMMGITDNNFLKTAVDVGTDILDIINKITDGIGTAAGKINKGFGAAVKSVLSLGLAFTGLRIGGKLVNKGLGFLGNIVDPNGKGETGLFGGLTGRRMANNAQLASQINTPIVKAINNLSKIVSSDKATRGSLLKYTNNSGIESLERQKQARKSLNTLMTQKDPTTKKSRGFSPKQVTSVFKGLTSAESAAIYSSSPILQKALADTFEKASSNLKLDKAGQIITKDYFKHINEQMSNGRVSIRDGMYAAFNPYIMGKEIGGDTGQAILKQLQTQALEKYGKDSRFHKQLVKMAAKKANAGELVPGKETDKWIADQKTKMLGAVTAREQGRAQEIQLTGLQAKMANFSEATNAAGSAVMGLGMALNTIGFETAGSVLTSIGMGIQGIGMAAQSASVLMTKFSTSLAALAANPLTWVIASGAIISAGIYALHKEEQRRIAQIQKDGKEVEKTYEDTIAKVTQNTNKLEEFKNDFYKLSQGVDKNGNNVSLGTEEYKDYQKIVKELIKINPKLVKGYNAQGQAIIDNNKAISESIKAQTAAKETAITDYTAKSSLKKLLDARNSTKRFNYGRQTGDYRTVGKIQVKQKPIANQFEKDTSSILNNIKQLEDSDEVFKILGEKYKVDFSTASADVVKVMQQHGADILSIVSDTAKKASDEEISAIDESIALLGKHTEGYEKVIEPIYKNLSTYAAKEGLFDDIPEEMQEAAQIGLKELAKLEYDPKTGKKMTASMLQTQAQQMAQEIQDMRGHSEQYQQILKNVENAQKEFGKTGDKDAYQGMLQTDIDTLAAWRDQLEESALKTGNAIDTALSESLTNTIASIESFTSDGVAAVDEGLNTMADAITSAQGAFENFQKSIESGDFYTAADSMKQIFDEIKDGIDDAGKGSQTYWKGVRELAGDKIADKGKKSLAEKALGNIKPMLKEGREGVEAFMDYLQNSGDKTIKGFAKGKDKIKDYFDVTDDRINFKNMEDVTGSDKKFKALAKTLELSDQFLTSMINKSKQFYDIDYTNFEQLRQGLAASENVIAGQIDKDTGQRNLVMKKSRFKDMAREKGYTDPEIKKLIKDARTNGIKLAPSTKALLKQDDKTGEAEKLAKYTKQLEIGQNDLQKFVDSYATLGYGKEEVRKLYEQARKDGLINDKGKSNFDDLYKKYQESIKVEPNSAEERGADAAERAANAAEALAAKEGFFNNPKEGAQALGRVRGDKNKEDTFVEYFGQGKDKYGHYLKTDENWREAEQALETEKKLDEERRDFYKGVMESADKGSKAYETAEKNYKQLDKAIKIIDKNIDSGKELRKSKSDTSANNTNNNTKDKQDKNQGNTSKQKTNTDGQHSKPTKEENAIEKFGSSFWGGIKDYYSGKSPYGQSPQTQIPGIGSLFTKIGGLFNPDSFKLNKTDRAAMLDAFPSMSEIGGKFSNFFGLEQTGKEGGIDGFVQQAGILTQKMGELGTKGQKAGLDLKTAFISAQQDGLNKINPKKLEDTTKSAAVTKENLEQIGKEHPEINVEATKAKKVVTDFKNGVEKTPIKQEIETVPKKEGKQSKTQPTVEKTNVAKDFKKTTSDAAKGQAIATEVKIQPKIKVAQGGGKEGAASQVQSSIQKSVSKKTIPVKTFIKPQATVKGSSDIQNKVSGLIKKASGGKQNAKTTVSVGAKTKGTGEVNNLSGAIKKVKDKHANVSAKVSGLSSVQSLVNAISNLHDKSITITTTEVKKKAATGMNNFIPHRSVPQAGSAARGKYGTIGPKDKGGLTLTGEKGFEIAWLPSENRSMILGANGPQMINLPNNAVVWTNEQSKKIMKQKAIPAGSQLRGTGKRPSKKVTSSTNDSSSNSSSSSSSSSRSSSSSKKKKSNKKNSKASSEELKDQKKVNTRIFNLEKQIEQVKNRQEKKQKEINKALQKTAITLLGISKTGTSYIATIRKNISLNKELVKIYNQQLKNLDSNTKKSATTIKWEQKYQKKTKKGKKKTTTKQKTATVNLGKYIEYDSATGAYKVNQDAINNDKRFNSKEAREAVKNAAQDKINDKVSKRDSAQKEIDSGNDALNEYAQQLYETFYGWKNELTEIYIQTKKIAALESQISRYKELTSLYDAQLSSGLQKATTEFTQKISEAFQVQINAAVNQIHAQSKNIDLNFDELLKINSTNDIEREISSVQQKISNGRIANTNAANYAKAQNKVNKDKKAIAAKKKVEQTTSLKKEQAKVKKSDNQIKAANKIINSKKSSKTKKANAQKTKAKATAAKKTANTNIKTIKEGQAAQKTVKADTTKANNLKAINNKTASSRLTEDQLIAEQKRLKELQDTLKAEGIAKELISFNPEQAKAGNISFDFNVEELLKRRDSGAISTKQYEVIKNKFDEISEKATELNNAYTEITQKITELYTQLTEVKEQYATVSEDLLEGIEKSSEEEAEKLQDLNESITNALRDLLDEVKKRLDQRRQQENNAKTEEDISQKQNRLNALRADSSGSNAKEIKQLEKEIADSQRDYERSLEDQALERLTEQADKAAEQRERIIEVLNNQLDYAKTSGQNLDRVNMLIDAVKDPTKIDKETLEQFKTEIQQYWRSNNNYDQSTIKRREVLDNQFETYWSSITGGLLGKEKTLEKAIEEVEAEQEKIEEATKGLLNQSNLQSDETPPIPEQKQSNAVTYSVPKNTVSNEEANKKAKENEAKKKAQEAAQKKAKETAQKKAKETAQKKAQETAQKKAKEAAYKKAINDAQSNGKIGKDEFLKVKSIAEAAGYGAARYMKDLANTKGLSWKQVIKAAKDAGFNRDRIAYTFTSDNARKGYKAVYGESWYTAYDRAKKRKVTAYKYATGGLNTQTGPAWLDGTPSKPELILNARDTQNFLALKDILNKTLTNAKTINNSNDMTNFEININVDKIEKDYDVDRMIERVKKEITRSSGYRNVATVRSFR